MKKYPRWDVLLDFLSMAMILGFFYLTEEKVGMWAYVLVIITIVLNLIMILDRSTWTEK